MRESVIYQDILEEGREEGREQGELSAKLNSIPRLSVLGLSVEQIAQALDLEIEQVQQVIEGQN
ncbi:aspartate aminotransferase [Microcystis aeruginosa]|jgi:predicted transposase/invertase (TIGR01784 family)|uniref:Aspartate aminotransferase n=1 Tax=Microcystis aeruginosa FD4 TaxID=2686288 RepID=A0A857D9K7_MICAE|nr:aspartate aminotransferase [Microcystis aeruginosa]QGZ89613.1 aspartate aminotransferase [Microcystis aeruginosa FD4]QGZ89617.1 aspartate aminotransferase [Microcystis aeruginosa FD4]QGZ91909.1 aspartate aminotransferase [Microcystis aeruginosa FD4]